MIKELHTAALTMMNAQTRLEVTSNNIANANTTAFKRAAVFERNLVDAKAGLFNVPMQLERNDPPIGSYLDWSAGPYSQTGNPLDVAIEGRGFFVCKTADGATTLTRNGSFRLNSEGFLVTVDGKFVMGVDEDAILIPDYATINDSINHNEKTSVEIVIAKNGQIYANDVAIGKLLVVDCDDYSQMIRVSNQDFIPQPNVGIHRITDEMLTIKQNWLEGSNVNIIDEMITMIELQRTFETGTKIIQTNDSTLEKSIATARYGYY